MDSKKSKKHARDAAKQLERRNRRKRESYRPVLWDLVGLILQYHVSDADVVKVYEEEEEGSEEEGDEESSEEEEEEGSGSGSGSDEESD